MRVALILLLCSVGVEIGDREGLCTRRGECGTETIPLRVSNARPTTPSTYPGDPTQEPWFTPTESSAVSSPVHQATMPGGLGMQFVLCAISEDGKWKAIATTAIVKQNVVSDCLVMFMVEGRLEFDYTL